MRLRNKKNATLVVQNSEYVIQNPEEWKGKWQEVFNNTQRLEIEIGTGRGIFIIQMAMRHPDVNFIGIEMYDSVLMSAVEKLKAMEPTVLSNLRLIRMDAHKIADVFDHEVSRIYLNFSDPWPKARHAKRRLTSHEFLERYENILKEKKEIFQKTDNDDLFAFSMQSLKESGYTLKNVTNDLHSFPMEENVETEYEKKFLKKNKKINRLEAYKG